MTKQTSHTDPLIATGVGVGRQPVDQPRLMAPQTNHKLKVLLFILHVGERSA